MQPQILMPGGRGNALFSDFIDQIETDIIIANAQGRILNCNKSILDAWGGTIEDYLTGKILAMNTATAK